MNNVPVKKELDGILKYLQSLKKLHVNPEGGFKIFPSLTKLEFERIYANSVATSDQIDSILRVFKKVEVIVEDTLRGKSDFILAPFGSLTNGFMLRQKYDLDIALIIKDE